MTFLQPKKTVLLVEEHDATRKSLLRMIAKKGCYVLSVKTMEDARRAISGTVDIAILDGDWPSENVEILRSQLHSMNPTVRVLVNTTQPAKFADVQGVEVFEKPKEVKAIAAALHDCE